MILSDSENSFLININKSAFKLTMPLEGILSPRCIANTLTEAQNSCKSPHTPTKALMNSVSYSPEQRFPYEPVTDLSFRWGGFFRRMIAFLFDTIPIVLGVATIYYFFTDFNETLQAFFKSPRDPVVRGEFLTQRNQIRNISFVVYLFYCVFLEYSPLQGTPGKRLMGLKVVDYHGGRLSLNQALSRNFSKSLSALPLSLGFLWTLWSPKKQAWHDSLAKTYVVR